MQTNIDNFWDSYKRLHKGIENTNNDMKNVFNLFNFLKQAYENFGNTIRLMGENFHKDISKDQNESDKFSTYYQYLGNYLLKVANINKELSTNIDSAILTPYREYANSIQKANHEALEKCNKNLLSIEHSRSLLKKNQDNFYKLSKSAEKLQDNFEKAALDEHKTPDQIKKAQDKLLKLKMEAQEAGNLYRSQITTTNHLWDKLYKEFKDPFKVFDENEESRAQFTRNTVINVVKFLNSFYASKDSKLNEDPEQKFKESESHSGEESNSFKHLTHGVLDDDMKEKPVEEYLSYEAKKKVDDDNLQKAIDEEEFNLYYSNANKKDIQFLRDFVKIFKPIPETKAISKNNANNTTQNNQSMTTNASETESQSDEKSQPEESKEGSPTKLTPQEEEQNYQEREKRLWQVLAVSVNRKFFMNQLSKIREPVNDSYEIKLKPKDYDHLRDILARLLDDMITDKDFENIVEFLPLTTKYFTRKDGQTEYFYRVFRTHDIWGDEKIWLKLMGALYEKKMSDESIRAKKTASFENAGQNQIVGKLFSFGVSKISNFLDPGKAKNIPDRETYSAVLHELTFYLGRLTKNILVSSEILIELVRQSNSDKRELEELMNTQKREIDEILKDRIRNYSLTKKKKSQKKWGQQYHIYLSLDFLEIKDLLNLISLSTETRKLFYKKVHRKILTNFANQISQKQRWQLWCNVLEINDFKVNFKDMLEHYHVLNKEKALKNVEEVIEIDVQRSFNNHKNCDPQILKNLLKAYAAHDREVSYCQGMNYMMGFLYINLQDPELSFKCFCKTMELIRPLFDHEFKQLKKVFFKFTRILELYLPELSDHFKREKVEPSYFVAPWFITGFSSAFQYSTHSMFLEKIWDQFLLDGVKIIYKVGLIILLEFKDKLLDMKFDQILNFLSEMGREELFSNIKYFKVKEGTMTPEEAKADKEHQLVENLEKKIPKIKITAQLIQLLDVDYEVFEVRLQQLLRPSTKKTNKSQQQH